NLIASGEAGKLIRGRCPERELRDGRSAKVTGWARKPASSQFNVRPCETRYSTIAACSHQCGQILETLKGNTAKLCKLQILSLDWSTGYEAPGERRRWRYRMRRANSTQGGLDENRITIVY